MSTKITDIEIFAGKPDFEFEPIRTIEAKCESSHAFSSAPSMDEVNTRLRALAAKVGANAIVNVNYDSGVSLTSWRALKGTGLAVRRVSDDRQCPSCAETIKRAAMKCRFCGEVLEAEAQQPPIGQAAQSIFETSSPDPIGRPRYAERTDSGTLAGSPLKDSDAMPIWVWVLLAVVVIGGMLAFMG